MNYHDIKKCDMLNGDGIRVSLWVSGCEHNCNQCQNPQTWDANNGIVFDEGAERELFLALHRDYISGLTLTGGDPLYENNIQDVLNLVNKIRILFGDSKTIWIYSGYTWEQCLEDSRKYEIIKQCDVFIDGEYIDDIRDVTLEWRGSSNQRVIDVQKSIAEGNVVLYEV